MKECNLCKEAYGFNFGLEGNASVKTKIMFVLHRSDNETTEFFGGYLAALRQRNTGIILERMLQYCNLDFNDIYLTNLFKCLLPKDRTPSIQEYQNCFEVFKKQITEFNPVSMVAFGPTVYEYLFPKNFKEQKLSEVEKKILYCDEIPELVIPTLILPHPSYIWKFHPGFNTRMWKKLCSEKQEPYFKALKEFLERFDLFS